MHAWPSVRTRGRTSAGRFPPRSGAAGLHRWRSRWPSCRLSPQVYPVGDDDRGGTMLIPELALDGVDAGLAVEGIGQCQHVIPGPLAVMPGVAESHEDVVGAWHPHCPKASTAARSSAV